MPAPIHKCGGFVRGKVASSFSASSHHKADASVPPEFWMGTVLHRAKANCRTIIFVHLESTDTRFQQVFLHMITNDCIDFRQTVIRYKPVPYSMRRSYKV